MFLGFLVWKAWAATAKSITSSKSSFWVSSKLRLPLLSKKCIANLLGLTIPERWAMRNVSKNFNSGWGTELWCKRLHTIIRKRNVIFDNVPLFSLCNGKVVPVRAQSLSMQSARVQESAESGRLKRLQRYATASSFLQQNQHQCTLLFHLQMPSIQQPISQIPFSVSQ